MSVGGGGQSQNQSGTQSGQFSGNTTGINLNNSSQTGTQTGTSSATQTGSVTPTTTTGWQTVDQLMRGNIASGGTGLNPGQTDAYSLLRGWASNPNNTVSQISAVTPQIQGIINQPAPQMAGTAAIDAPTVTAKQGADFMGSYQNPFTQQVVDATTADMNNGLLTGLNALKASYGGQLGNGREGVAAGQAVGDYTRALGTTIGNLRSGGFTTAAGLGQTDASRALTADTSNQGATLTAKDINTQAALRQQEINAQLEAQKHQQDLAALQSIVGNAVTSGAVGTDTVKTLFDMAGGGNANLATYLGLQPTGQSSTGTTTGSTSGTTTGDSSSTGINLGSSSGQSSGSSSGHSNSKGGGVSFTPTFGS